jgi:DNA-binding NarL/FixJ family response regulator
VRAGDSIEVQIAEQAARTIPIVVVTAKDLTEEDRRRLDGDVAGLVQKGGSGRDEFLAEIRELVESMTAASR